MVMKKGKLLLSADGPDEDGWWVVNSEHSTYYLRSGRYPKSSSEFWFIHADGSLAGPIAEIAAVESNRPNAMLRIEAFMLDDFLETSEGTAGDDIAARKRIQTIEGIIGSIEMAEAIGRRWTLLRNGEYEKS